MNELDLYLENRFDVYYTEMKTREEYAIRKFKKKYDYDPKTKTIKGPDGERIEIDMDIKNPKMKITSFNGKTKTEERRTTSSDTLSPTPKINLDDRFFKLKNQKRRNAILQHEIGHTKLHSLNNSKNELKTTNAGDMIAKNIINDIGEKYIRDGIYTPKEVKDLKNRGSLSIRKNQLVKKYTGSGIDETKKSNSLRKSSLEKFKVQNVNYRYHKHTDKNGNRIKKDDSKVDPHTNAFEFEADRYAANKSGSKELKKALRESYKLTKNKINKNKNVNDNLKKSLRQQGDNALKIRSKTLDSKDILSKDEKNNYN